MTQTVARDRFSPSLPLSLSRRVTSHHVNAAVTQFQRPLPPRGAPLPSFPLFPVFIRSLCFNLSVPLSLFLQLLKKKVCNCFFLFFWRGHGCNLASFFFCFFPQGGYLSHYFCRMEAKLPRTRCNPLRVTTSTGSSLCPTVLQTAFHPPPSVRFTPQLLIIIIIIINKMQVSLPTRFLHLLGRKHNGLQGATILVTSAPRNLSICHR